MSNYFVKNPKLFISNYYDFLIRQIDIHTEELLEHYTEDDLLSDTASEPADPIETECEDDPVFEDEASPDREECYGIETYKDPYSDEFKFDFMENAKTPNLNPKFTKIRDYLNDLREDLIKELSCCQKISMECLQTDLESFKSELKEIQKQTDDEKMENLKKILFDKFFVFVLKIDQTSIKDNFLSKLSKNDSIFKLYVVILDFYLNSYELELFK